MSSNAYKIMNDNQFVEGLIGGFGWVIVMYYMKLRLKGVSFTNNTFVDFMSWVMLWYMRKVGMNLYKDFKRHQNIQDREIIVSKNVGHAITALFYTILVGSTLMIIYYDY